MEINPATQRKREGDKETFYPTKKQKIKILKKWSNETLALVKRQTATRSSFLSQHRAKMLINTKEDVYL